MGERGTAVAGRGPRAVERRLLADIGERLAAARTDPRLLAQPVRVLVASGELRSHLASRLVAEHGAIAGVRVETLNRFASGLLAEAGDRLGDGDALFPILVRRAARQQGALRDALDGLEDGYAVVASAVADLLDAGFDPDFDVHRDAIGEAIAECEFPPATRKRVDAIVATAEQTAGALAALEVARRGARLARAAELLTADPDRVGARAVLVHGFADATGAVSELLDALVRDCGARVYLDLPPDPAEPGRADLGTAFVDRLVGHLGLVVDGEPEASPAPELLALRAVGIDAEIRGVAQRVLALCEAGTRPESIAIVARDIGSYAVAVRTHFERLGIAFAAPASVSPASGSQRRLHGLVSLLSEGERASSDRWLDVLGPVTRSERSDLRIALHALGAPRLGRVAEIDLAVHLDSRSELPLPVRVGLAESPEGDRVRAQRRKLSGAVARRAVVAAQAAVLGLADWPAQAALRLHIANLQEFVHTTLEWAENESRVSLDKLLRSLDEAHGDVPMAFEEFVLLLRKAVGDVRGGSDASDGAGVRVLGVVEARARTFEHLFVVGANRDVFPRSLPEDALFPDAVRRPLESVLPEIPLRSRGFEEEHYLFAQLVAASPQVTLSWQVADDDGRARSASPFVERLRGAGRLPDPEDVPGAYAAAALRDGGVRTAAESAVLEGLHGAPEAFAVLLGAAADEVARFHAPAASVAGHALARGRMNVMRELGDRPATARLGPYFGFVGAVVHPADARRADLYVTQLERLVRCPWEHFLTQCLRVEPAPNALDALPEASALRVGNLVHDVLEQIVVTALGSGASDFEANDAGVEVPWPSAHELDRLLAARAAELARSEGIGVPGFDRLLVEIARPLLAPAREYGWPLPESGVTCVGAEISDSLEVGLPPRALHFRADRVDREGGVPRLIDYKTGKPKSQGTLARDVAKGERLQAAAYAFASGGQGRYLYLAAEKAAAAMVDVDSDDIALREAFDNAVDTALVARDAGAFFPRLTEPGTTQPAKQCAYCDVREACAQGDAGARARFAAWAELERGDTPADAQALTLLRLATGASR